MTFIKVLIGKERYRDSDKVRKQLREKNQRGRKEEIRTTSSKNVSILFVQ